ncbi:MAG: hypothetical protein AAB551_00890 [Patescibacteria group bacterium]
MAQVPLSEAGKFDVQPTMTTPLTTSTRGAQLHFWTKVDSSSFEPSKGDFFMADLENSVGYLVNDHSRQYVAFPILSGRRQFSYYLGRYYFAETPDQTWAVKEDNILSDRVTFSKSGRFLRLFDGEKRTSYGIHGHLYFSTMIGRENKYVSYGCVLVDDNILTLIEKSFHANNDFLKVTTTKDQRAFDFLRIPESI